MTDDFIFRSAQRQWESPPEFDEPDDEHELPDVSKCPFCRKDLGWDYELDEPKCETPGCSYDNGLTDEENRARFVAEGS